MLKKLSKIVRCELPKSVPEKSLNQTKIISKICTVFFMSLHDFCLNSLNHEITQALACGKSLSKSTSFNLLADFGLLHFFVISGAHFNFVLAFLEKSKISNKHSLFFQQVLLFAFVAMCNYSPPIFRVFIVYILKINVSKICFFLPPLINHFTSYLFCLVVFSNSRNLMFSASLSFLFSVLIFSSKEKSKIKTSQKLYFTALPFFLFVFGLPHYSSLILTPITGLLMSLLLLPLSIASIFFDYTEVFAIETWWNYRDFIQSTSIFFGFPKKFSLENQFMNPEKLILFNVLIFIFTSAGVVLWRRKSYSFS